MALSDVSTIVLLVRGLETYAYHGVPDAEQEIGHRYRFDLDLTLSSCGAMASDQVAETVDYGAVSRAVLAICQQNRYRTLERLAEVTAAQLYLAFPLVMAIDLTVVKPLPPAPVMATALGVRHLSRRPNDPGSDDRR